MNSYLFKLFLCVLAIAQGVPLSARTQYRRRAQSSRLTPKKVVIKKLVRAVPKKPAASTRYSPLRKRTSHRNHGSLQLAQRRIGALVVANNIHKVAQNATKKASVGVKIVSLKTGKILYQINQDKLFTPASNTKMFTAAAAYHILGPHHRFDTELLTNKQLSLTRLDNLYIKGSGDPTLTAQDLEKLVLALKARSIKEINNLVIDSSIFDTSTSAPGWTPGDGPIFDKSPVGGLIVNHSCISVRVKAAKIVGHKPIVFLDPAQSVMIENKAKTVGSGNKSSLHVTITKNNTIVVTGTIAKGKKQKYYRFAVAQPHVFAGHALLDLIKKHKISCRGKLLIGKTPVGARVLAHHQSEPTHAIIRYMMKHSDNLYADALFKKMAFVAYGSPGSWEKGRSAVMSFLKKTGIPVDGFIVNDGSGLSHANKISPNHLSAFLQWIYSSAPWKGDFMDTLPISGVDGTLRHRMKNTSSHAKVKAKTGTLRGVSSLSGYITPQKGEPFLFVIFANRKNKSAIEFRRKLEDQISTLLAAHAFSSF
jgi:D-alanyl-D-alanine carboxypeptidase/D-alanyl-D-alanine-endopeptidase (penicillin-binding protein 4)